MWIARDEDGTIQIFVSEPTRTEANADAIRRLRRMGMSDESIKTGGFWIVNPPADGYYTSGDTSYMHTRIPDGMFPEITWESGAVEVDPVIKTKDGHGTECTKRDFALFLRNETGAGIAACAAGVDKLIDAFRHMPKPVMDRPCRLVVRWERDED